MAAIAAVNRGTRSQRPGRGRGVRTLLPGVTASFIDMLTGTEGFAYGNFPLYYSGSLGKARPLELGGQVTTNVKGTIWADTSLLVYESPWHLLGGEYATAIAIPYISVDVKATAQFGPLSRRVHDSASGISDLEFFPLMLVWTEGDLKWGTNFGIFAPTGGFTKGNLANTGKNYWTFEPSLNIGYLSTTTGLELTAFAGFDVNTQTTSPTIKRERSSTSTQPRHSISRCLMASPESERTCSSISKSATTTAAGHCSAASKDGPSASAPCSPMCRSSVTSIWLPR